MIWSNKYKFVFIPIPKNASESIKFDIRPFLNTKIDWEQSNFKHKSFSPINEIASYTHGHITYNQIVKYLPNDYYVFAIKRNPIERFKSGFKFLYNNYLNLTQTNLDSLMIKELNLVELNSKYANIIFKRQTDFLSDKVELFDITEIDKL